MKLTANLLKQLIKEELTESYDDYEYKRNPRRGSRDAISYARNVYLYTGREGMKAFPIRKKSDGEFMRFFINKDGEEIEIFVTSNGAKVLRMGRVVSTGERIDLIPQDTSGNFRYGGRGNIFIR
tara:strand:+ start:16 stop:387 length:372 start_codon:yes stop_codon:yes gene_type:complete